MSPKDFSIYMNLENKTSEIKTKKFFNLKKCQNNVHFIQTLVAPNKICITDSQPNRVNKTHCITALISCSVNQLKK
jgi:hypothetical protein